jgi:hypothetical protein
VALDKPLIILLTGPSGAGKTTSILPTFERHGISSVGTGDFGKALISILVGDYEAWKTQDPEAGKKACIFFDALRYVDVDFWVKITLKLIQNQPLNPKLYPAAQDFTKSLWAHSGPVFVSEAVNVTELMAWKANWPNLLVVALDPENPKARNADNRSPVPEELINVRLAYRLEDSISMTENFINQALRGKDPCN